MALRFNQHTYAQNGSITTASTNVLIGPIDISNFETFGILFQNNNTAISISGSILQFAYDPSANVSQTAAPNWFNVGTASVPFPCAILASAGYLTTPIANCFHWMRVLGGITQTGGTTCNFTVTVGGFTRDS